MPDLAHLKPRVVSVLANNDNQRDSKPLPQGIGILQKGQSYRGKMEDTSWREDPRDVALMKISGNVQSVKGRAC
jgi:hypothetical protein